MKKTFPQNKEHKTPKPELKWQTGEYIRYPTFKLVLPYQFLLLCRLTETTPEQMLIDFMDNLSCGSWKRAGRDETKAHLINYFVSHGYGQQHYTETEIREMFKQMDAVGMLFPSKGSVKMIDRYSKWRAKHQTYWFKQWWRKTRRQDL